jgi:hypothetical protein
MAEQARRDGDEEGEPAPDQEGGTPPAPAIDPPDVAPDEDAPGRSVPS